MKIVVASDIHGINASLRSLLAVLGDPVILSPWLEDGCPFASEEDAVHAFHAKNGLRSYAQKIADVVEDQPAFLIGFSVGATSLWRYIASQRCHVQSRAFLYYGSRIRDAVGLIPRCPATVVFAEHEPSFSPASVAASIAGPGVACSVIENTHHGFMNPSSRHYRPDIAGRQLELLRSATEEGATTQVTGG
ncbi:hypothetical protein PQH03_17535 [Ralstonia insidiosa]|jgi:dienelactone hydrolase|uniref:hypothetical protein n=1 Tax=Ralstonia TaxID=48736 RepID=UPI00066494DB|nr:hypothetical protein [Ralstonia insidiosa]MBX3772335.1 hypothetical protein [Ralstonia pickettii]NOZ16506.1 hydrolase [Betaproteobacteria bacterium]MBA9856991.1 hydrolase [Ralstonia insidiosa]MBA9874007.1 hydrolase [Ralstonia insidiosa]MBA9913397.1 hydrolase [Ralstonia insidiosa]